MSRCNLFSNRACSCAFCVELVTSLQSHAMMWPEMCGTALSWWRADEWSIRAMKLNLGCGHVQPPGWLNVDGSNRAWLTSKMPWLDRAFVRIGIIPPTDFAHGTIVYANLLKRFPWDNVSVEAIYMGEILERFTRDEARHVVAECCRVLKRGGILRIPGSVTTRAFGATTFAIMR